MRLGLFLNFEHGDESNLAAFERQIDLAMRAEDVGLDELWVSEHHFSSFTQSGSVLPILAYLAGRTRRIRIGPAAILLPLHDPVRVAEDLATIDILSRGRLVLGLARGGPFPSQYRHFHVEPETAREQAAEAIDFLLRLLTKQSVTFQGRWYQSEDLTVFPRLVQTEPPVFIASASQETVAEAGRRGLGLMAGHAWSPSRIGDLREIYRGAAAQGAEPEFVILRNVCVADTDAEARAAAIPAMERFSRRMREHSGQPPKPVALESALETAIVGSPETCRRKLAALEAVVPRGRLVMKIACLDRARAVEVVARFRREVMPPQNVGSATTGPLASPEFAER